MPDPSTKLVRIGDRQVAYEAPAGTADGTGLPVFLIHGTSFNRKIWAAVVDGLAREHRPIAIDNPGHGESSLPPIGSIEEGAELFKALHDAFNLERIVLLGHSMGGAIAQLYYNRNPDDVLALGLVSTAPRFHLSTETVQRWLSDPATYREEEMGRIVSPLTSDAVRGRLFDMRDSTQPEAQRADLIACTRWDNEDRCHDIRVPVLALTADSDRDYLRESTLLWAEKLARVESVTIPGAGHMMMVEKPAETTAAILRWISSLTIESRESGTQEQRGIL
jgi:pimeloyl-ACP methyl ester carboxylesterase